MIALKTDPHVSWEDDYRDRVNPQLMTRLLHHAVPVLEWTGWHLTKVEPGFSESMLPLNVESTNQHGTHQAALISLSADYTGGMALTTLLTGTPLTGIHACKPHDSASMWLANMDVKYENPSTTNLTARCRVDAKTADRVAARYFAGKVALATLEVEFHSADGERVAVAKMRYFAQATERLMQKKAGQASPMAKLNLKTSARIIAGLRAAENEAAGTATPSHVRIDRPHDRIAAGNQGVLQAGRLQKVLPQLGTMVQARTRHCDQTLKQCPPMKQVVLLGAGLDMRPVRLRETLRGADVFELDLPDMLDERRYVFDRIHGDAATGTPQRHMIAADFIVDEVGEILRDHPAFSTDVPTFVIYEGCSMYFTERQNARILSSVMKSLTHPDSRVWMDCVTPEVIEATTPDPNIHEFVNRMELIGERFVYGPHRPAQLLEQCGLKVTDQITAGEYIDDADPTLAEYRFVVGQR
ncbi:MAG: SAM-dependent methyltransferase [Planctomycetota bacterium]